jgi:hypothetical protein
MYNIVLYLCVSIVFLLHRESLKLILAMDPLLRWFCHMDAVHGGQMPHVVHGRWTKSTGCFHKKII